MRIRPYIISGLALLLVAPIVIGQTQSSGIEQTSPGTRPPAELVESFDGLGAALFAASPPRNPSDNSLAVGPDHIIQTVNSQLVVFTKKGKRFDTTGKVLYGPIATNTAFAGLGGVCEARPNGDAVVRYDQLAGRWLLVMPIFRRVGVRPGSDGGQTGVRPGSDRGEKSPVVQPAAPGELAQPGQAAQPGAAAPFGPPPPLPSPATRGQGPPAPAPPPTGRYAICYAVSTTSDPLGPYYRYAFERPLFPDYPRPAVWPDGYYTPTSTGDDVIQKHVCVVDRVSMLKGLPATEQCVVIDGVNFLNTADVDGPDAPPPGAPNIVMAAGGTQLKDDLDDDAVFAWSLHVDWADPSKTKMEGSQRIAVAPYHYLCGGQLTNCVSQPDTDRKLDAQGDKIMPRVVYRRFGGHESIVAVHSIDTAAGGGGVRWYEFRLDRQRVPQVHQQGTYAPDGFYRWMASPAIDRFGNIGIGYSFGGTPHFAGQRFAGRVAADPPGQLTMRETILAEGEASQSTTMRWEDYTQTAIDPSDDCTVWYVGDYLKKDATSYTTRIGAFRMPGCGGR
ncbi:MAG TPA: hypothetical protein VL882_08715 [Vicinamibacterales bacterium]|nr:hypothetical protein [Vicinamibacterales bacterium]